MQLTRRTLFGHSLVAAMGGLAAGTQARAQQAAPAPAPDPRMAPRIYGNPASHARAQEWFSFTCPHCARFSADIFPQIQARLIDTGKIAYEFCEYPRDQVDLMAACVARSLPVERYLPFTEQLLATQMQWAFAPGVDPKEELAKQAALAGMSRSMFDAAISDEGLKAAILAAQAAVEKQYNIDSTPTFIINGTAHSGETDYATFAGWLGV